MGYVCGRKSQGKLQGLVLCSYTDGITIYETRKFVIDGNKPKIHAVIYTESTKRKARKCIANKLMEAKIKLLKYLIY